MRDGLTEPTFQANADQLLSEQQVTTIRSGR
jgi:hypothetical protein